MWVLFSSNTNLGEFAHFHEKNSWKYSAGDSLYDSIGDSDVYSDLYDVSAC